MGVSDLDLSLAKVVDLESDGRIHLDQQEAANRLSLTRAHRGQMRDSASTFKTIDRNSWRSGSCVLQVLEKKIHGENTIVE